MKPSFQTAGRLESVRYEVRGALSRRARELERQGNDVSELVDLTLRSLLESGDEVLIPAPHFEEHHG